MKWEKEVQEEHVVWWDHLVWKVKEEGLVGMVNEDYLVHLAPRVNLVFKDFLVLLDQKETEGTREMLGKKEMMDQEE